MGVRASRLIVLVLVCVAASFAARVASDALHVSGFYDSVGAYLAGFVLPWWLAAPVGLLVFLVLTAYYKVYLYVCWIGLLSALVGLVARRLEKRVGGLVLLLAPVAGLVYAVSWFLFYAWLANLWSYLPVLLGSRGFAVLFTDSMLCFVAAYAVSERLGRAGARLLYAMLAVLAVVAVVSWAYVCWSDYFVGSWFGEKSGWLLFRTHKMDLVWLPMGAKGTNTYYYPVDRFKRGSPGYQVWVGMYWVQGRHDIRDVGLVSQFAIWDQNVWLGVHGCPEPYTYVDLVVNITETKFHGFKAYLMYGGMVSRSDVKPYEEVRLRGFFITFYDPGTDHTGIVYACATEENYDKMIDVLWEIVKSFAGEG